jgi:hypothetical protein
LFHLLKIGLNGLPLQSPEAHENIVEQDIKSVSDPLLFLGGETTFHFLSIENKFFRQRLVLHKVSDQEDADDAEILLNF